MLRFAKAYWWISTLSLALAHGAAAGDVLRLAALDTPGGPPPCGADGICNLAACRSDPDCPGNLPDRPEPTSSDEPSRPSNIVDCQARERDEIGLAVDWGATRWNDYERVLEDIRDWPVTIGNCLENRFKENGKVVCEATMRGGCTDADGSTNNGFGGYPSHRAHFCSDWRETVRALPDPVSNRQACYFALVTHEWGHTCARGHKTLEIIDDEAFDYWKRNHPDVTIVLGDCAMR
jgi:hypothetical protein